MTDSGVLIPGDMLPAVKEVDVQVEDGGLVITPLQDPDDPLWEIGNDPVTCGLPDASEKHDRTLYKAGY